MKLSVKGFALTCALSWGSAVLVVGVVNRIVPYYGWWFLKTMESLYPGYFAGYGLKNLLIGILYALLDGALGGAFFAWLYNLIAGCCRGKSEGAN